MKRGIYFLILLIVIFAGWFTVQANKPSLGPHGGVVKATGDYYAEAGKSTNYLYAFLLDSTMQPISNDAMTCQAIVDFPDKTTATLELLPFAHDGFRSPVMERTYKKCTFIFEKNGKRLSAEFENEGLIVINAKQ
jgi:hypothetical protein